MKKIDYHCHFSGSLSGAFLSKCPGGSGLAVPKYGHNWKENFNLFFSSYEKINSITKSDKPLQQIFLYTEGSKDICNGFINQGVDEFHLRIGPRKNLEETVRRIVSTTNGFKQAEAESKNGEAVGKIILTLIHDKDGHFFNVDEHSLRELLAYLRVHPSVGERVIGFDFSGPENKCDMEMLFTLLEYLCNYNKELTHPYEIAVHAGEYIDPINYLDQFKYLEKLLGYDITRLSHGTLLWLNPNLIDSSNTKLIEEYQNKLLSVLVKKKIHLEICPTANQLLSPLEKISDIPISKLNAMGINYSLSTDNKTLFNTTLQKELDYFPSDIAKPLETAVKGSKMTNLSPKIPVSNS